MGPSIRSQQPSTPNSRSVTRSSPASSTIWKSSRNELRKVISALDDEIQSPFLSAFEEIAEAYERHFAVLFPAAGAAAADRSRRLALTGVEIEAQPLGKKVTAMTLLSGGERSLAALAFLFAVFDARPSPFYVLDEVEAALDDANLHRFVRLLDEFRPEGAAGDHHPPAADHGGGRRALRRHDGTGRLLEGRRQVDGAGGRRPCLSRRSVTSVTHGFLTIVLLVAALVVVAGAGYFVLANRGTPTPEDASPADRDGCSACLPLGVPDSRSGASLRAVFSRGDSTRVLGGDGRGADRRRRRVTASQLIVARVRDSDPVDGG
jgi:hypothetical protein